MMASRREEPTKCRCLHCWAEEFPCDMRVPMTVHESPSLMYGQLRVINIVPIDILHYILNYIAIFWGSRNSQTRQAISLAGLSSANLAVVRNPRLARKGPKVSLTASFVQSWPWWEASNNRKWKWEQPVQHSIWYYIMHTILYNVYNVISCI